MYKISQNQQRPTIVVFARFDHTAKDKYAKSYERACTSIYLFRNYRLCLQQLNGRKLGMRAKVYSLGIRVFPMWERITVIWFRFHSRSAYYMNPIYLRCRRLYDTMCCSGLSYMEPHQQSLHAGL